MADDRFADWNAKIIQEFRANDGRVGGPFEGAPMILIHHRGAKTGKERISPLVYQLVGEDFAIFASKGGSPTHPDWYRNLRANPDISVEVGGETYNVHARVLEGEEREEIWTTQKERMPGFADYEERAKASREIPVILLERTS